MPVVASTVQKQFRASILTLLSEETGSQLVKFMDYEGNAVGEDCTFNRLGESSTSKTLDLFASSPTSTGGATSKVTVTLAPIYAADWLKETDLLKTSVDLKSAYVKSFKRALDRSKDVGIIAALVTAKANLTKVGDVAKSLKENFPVLVQQVAKTVAMADANPDHVANVAVAMNPDDFGKLFSIPEFASSDYAKQLGTGYTALAGAQIVATKSVAKGTIYIIPANTVCAAAWKGGDKASADFVPGKDAYGMVARTSFGATVGALDAPSVIEVSVKP